MERKVLQAEKEYLKNVENEIDTLQTSTAQSILDTKIEIENQKNILQKIFMKLNKIMEMNLQILTYK